MCADGVCACPAGQMDCDGACVNVQVSVVHCGQCHHMCAASKGAICEMGQCRCSDGKLDCNGTCVDGASDSTNCGACGQSCPADSQCISGVCQCAAVGLTACGATCTDLQSDAAHCGVCSISCPAAPHSSPLCNAGQCSWACEAGFADCNGDAADGCEANIANDGANCGACGQSCRGASCSAGLCAPTQIVTGASISDLALSGNALYFVQTGTPQGQFADANVQSVPVSGGVTTVLVPGVDWTHSDYLSYVPGHLTANGNALFWLTAYGSVRTVATNGSGLKTIVTSDSMSGLSTGWIVADANYVYWTDEGEVGMSNGRVLRVGRGGGSVSVLASSEDVPRGIVVDSTGVYWCNQGNGALRTVSLGGGAVRTLVSGIGSTLESLALDGDVLYVSDSISKNGSIWRVKEDGSALQRLVANEDLPQNLVVNDGWVYYSTSDGVKKATTTGGVARLLADGPALDLAVDGGWLYWSDGAAIWRINR